jgi:hypothetical protein
MPRENPRKLSDILDGRNLEELAHNFNSIEAAPEYEPVPAGSYEVDFVHGELCRSTNGNTGYTCHFEIAGGECRGRRIYHTLWLSEAAMAYSKRDLAKLGIVRLEQCEEPIPPGIFCTVKVVERTEDNGTRRNRVVRIDAGGIRNDPTGDPDFASPLRPNTEKGGTR